MLLFHPFPLFLHGPTFRCYLDMETISRAMDQPGRKRGGGWWRGNPGQPWWLTINGQSYKLLHCLSHCFSCFFCTTVQSLKAKARWQRWKSVVETGHTANMSVKEWNKGDTIATKRMSCPQNELAWDLLLIYSWWAYPSHICPLLFPCGLRAGQALC